MHDQDGKSLVIAVVKPQKLHGVGVVLSKVGVLPSFFFGLPAVD